MTKTFQTSQVARLLRTTDSRINKLLDRFKIRQSITGGGKRGQSLRFEIQALCHVALALWLFQAGLRALAIRRILNQSEMKGLIRRLRDLEHIRAEANRGQFLVVHGLPKKKITFGNIEGLQEFLREDSCVVIPLGTLLRRLAERLETFVI